MIMKSNRTLFLSSHDRLRKSGSALLIAIVLSFVLGLLSLSYLKLAVSEHRSSVRSTAYASSLNLAESAVEMALADLKIGSKELGRYGEEIDPIVRYNLTTNIEDRSFQRKFDYLIKNPSADDNVDLNDTDLVIYGIGIISHRLGSVPDITKVVQVTLTEGFKPFVGYAARNGIEFVGNNVKLDSYNSNYGLYGETMNQAGQDANYGVDGVTNKNDNIVVASTLRHADGLDDPVAVSVGNGDVFGLVQTSQSSIAEVNAQGMVSSYDNIGHDPTRVTNDYYENFPMVLPPSRLDEDYTDLVGISGTMTIQGSDDPDNPRYYTVGDIRMSGKTNNRLTVTGHVVLVTNGDISISGRGIIVMDSTNDSPDKSSLTIYTEGDVAIGGNGISNGSARPSNLNIVGTADLAANGTAGQTIQVSGNGQLAATVYAPNAAVEFNGGGNVMGGNVMGAMVALSAKLTGGASFHFDEALVDLNWGTGVYTIKNWLELSGETELTKADGINILKQNNLQIFDSNSN